jgi:hypothetical protein
MSSEDEDDEEDEEAIWAEESYTTRCVTQSLSHSATLSLCHSVTLSLCHSPRYHTTRSNATTTRHHRDSCYG